MELVTVQIAQWRLIPQEFILHDVTFKSKDPDVRRLFAPPNFKMIQDYKSGVITEEEYTDMYLEFLDESSKKYKEEWNDFLSKPNVAIGCWCGKDTFCHRELLARYFLSYARLNNLEVKFLGEVTKEGFSKERYTDLAEIYD